jgi:PAS domain S-box-containing protein
MSSPPIFDESEEFYRTLVENAAEGMLTIDAESTIVYANPAIEDILGYTPEELVGSSKMKIIPERLRPVHASALASYVQTGKRNIDWDGMELPALHKDGHEVPVLISLREHDHDDEQYFTGIVRDITERRERETQLRKQKERLDEFADILAHDIRNPLSVAQGYTELAREEHDDVPELDDIAESLSRIHKLVDDVLALSKEGQLIGETEPVDIEACVRESWRNVETMDATMHVDSDLGTIDADESRFEELLANLFRNAIEHAGESVTVRVGRDADALYVADDGPGIDDSVRGRIFEHGYSAGEEGTGYGLSIVRQIADAHGWEISVVDGDGGARFEFAGV